MAVTASYWGLLKRPDKQKLATRQGMRHSIQHQIAEILEERFGGTARLSPSCRLWLIAALRAFFEPGGRVALIAPLCEVVALSTYAAGLRPVFVDSCSDSPTIDVERLRRLERDRISGVVATNLYGLPEALPALRQLCRERAWTLIEGAAQVLDSETGGQRVGTFGEATVLSFKKFFDEACGVVLCRRSEKQASIDELLSRYAAGPSRRSRFRARSGPPRPSSGPAQVGASAAWRRLFAYTMQKAPAMFEQAGFVNCRVRGFLSLPKRITRRLPGRMSWMEPGLAWFPWSVLRAHSLLVTGTKPS